MAEQLVFAKGQAPEATRTIVVAGINDLQSKTENEIASGINLFDGVATANGLEAYIATIPPSGSASYTQAYESKRVAVNDFIKTVYGDRAIDCESALDTDGDANLDAAFILENDGLGFHLNAAGEEALALCINAKLI